jgi:hypothetical protein
MITKKMKLFKLFIHINCSVNFLSQKIQVNASTYDLEHHNLGLKKVSAEKIAKLLSYNKTDRVALQQGSQTQFDQRATLQLKSADEE